MINEVTFSFSKRHGERNRGDDAVGGDSSGAACKKCPSSSRSFGRYAFSLITGFLRFMAGGTAVNAGGNYRGGRKTK